MGWGVNTNAPGGSSFGGGGGSNTAQKIADGSITEPDQDQEFLLQWQHIAAQAEAAGVTKEQAWASYNKAGRPRGKDSEHWQQQQLSPQAQADRNTAPITPDQGALDLVRQTAGLPGPNEGAGADQHQTLAPPDPVQQAIAGLQGSDTASAAQQQAAMAGLQGAGGLEAGQQQDLIKQLQLAASGQGPSAALALFQLALGKSIGAQQSAAAGIRGGNAAAAARNASFLGSDMQMQGAQTSAAIRAQEQQAAQGLLGTTLAQSRDADIARAGAVADVAGQVRGQDIAKAGTVAQITAANAALEEQKRQAQVGTALSLLQTDIGVQGANNSLALDKIGMGTDFYNQNANRDVQYAGIKAQKEAENRAFWSRMIGSALGAGSAFMPFLLGSPGAPSAPAAPTTPATATVAAPTYYAPGSYGGGKSFG